MWHQVVLLKNMVEPEDVDPLVTPDNFRFPCVTAKQLEQEIAEECSKFGKVSSSHQPLLPFAFILPHSLTPTPYISFHVDRLQVNKVLIVTMVEQGSRLVKVFVEFGDQEAAAKAVARLDKRWFGGKVGALVAKANG